MLVILASAGELLMQARRLDRALELLMLVSRHPAAERETRARARQLLVQHEHESAPDMDGAAMQRDVAADLDMAVSCLLVGLKGPQVLLQ